MCQTSNNGDTTTEKIGDMILNIIGSATFDKYWPGKKFVVQIDEDKLLFGDIFVVQAALFAYFVLCLQANAMFRTCDHSQMFECAYDEFMALRPCARLYITTTPVPLLLVLKEEREKGEVNDVKFVSIQPCVDYIGVDQMVVTST